MVTGAQPELLMEISLAGHLGCDFASLNPSTQDGRELHIRRLGAVGGDLVLVAPDHHGRTVSNQAEQLF
jgi:hypothetical protein